jgi:hypothetical protein
MQVGVKYEALKKIGANKNGNYLRNYLSWSIRNDIEKEEIDNQETAWINLSDMSKADCMVLKEDLIKINYNKKSINSVDSWIKNLNNPKDAAITSLPHLEKTLKSVIKDSKYKWMLLNNHDGMLVPYAITEVKYRGRNRDDEAYVHLSLSCVSISCSSYYSDDAEIKKEKTSLGINFYKNDLSPFDEEEFIQSFESEDDEEEDVETKKAKKPKVTKPKKGNYLLSKILFEKRLLFMDDNYIEEYQKDIDKVNILSKNIGQVYTCDSKGYVISDPIKNGVRAWKNLNDENKKAKLVIDSLVVKEINYQLSTNDFGTIDLPEHPYILTYDLTSFRYAVVHVNNIVSYKYNPKIIDSLVISKKKKDILSSLIGSKNNFEDIISGKSGGIVILSTGNPGLGKTLTAEVYSELMEKPLYSVQSSQLGISVNEIEKNLNKVLVRAEKWDAVLLIDEADCYIYERGKDILQNCIVGTFLRLMEYYNGILFLTSNRPDIIDDAIMSRVTLHIKYELPNKEENLMLWNILSKNFKLEISNETVEKLWQTYEPISGRDIRNLLKDISKCYSKEKEITLEMVNYLSEFLPFIKIKK